MSSLNWTVMAPGLHRELKISNLYVSNNMEDFFLRLITFDGFVKSRRNPSYVIPAKAGIQFFKQLYFSWTPAFAGVTTFYELVNFSIM